MALNHRPGDHFYWDTTHFHLAVREQAELKPASEFTLQHHHFHFQSVAIESLAACHSLNAEFMSDMKYFPSEAIPYNHIPTSCMQHSN